MAAFRGWNDAGDAATSAAKHLRRTWRTKPFAELDPEEYYDFTVTPPAGPPRRQRPQGALLARQPVLRGSPAGHRDRPHHPGGHRTALSLGLLLPPGAGPGIPPGGHAGGHARSTAGRRSAHTTRVHLRLQRRRGTRRTVGTAQFELRRPHRDRGRPGRGLPRGWAPFGVAVGLRACLRGRQPLPEGMPGADRACGRPAGAPRWTPTIWNRQAIAYEQEVDELISSDHEAQSYVSDLEKAFDSNAEVDLGSTERLVREVEEFLRRPVLTHRRIRTRGEAGGRSGRQDFASPR